MDRKINSFILIEAIIILALLVMFISLYIGVESCNKYSDFKKSIENTNNGLLSPRIYSGLLEPKSLLITNYAPLRNSLESFISENNLTVSVYVENLRNGAFMGINERVGFPAASLSKVPLAMLIMGMIEDGELSLDTPIKINESARTSTWGTLFKVNENKLPLRVLIERMLKESDNTAYNVLRDYLNPEDMALLLSYVDYYSEEAENIKEQNDGYITPKSMYNLFSSLYLSTMLEPQNSEYILSLLVNTSFDIKKTADLPDDVVVAHKFGTRYIGKIKTFSDCGIIYNKDMRIFYCVMSKDLEYNYAVQVIGAIVNKVVYYSLNARKTLDAFKNK
ncbi:serine hydrolase [Candidatus Woesearchaeota archaeon]|nr:serine hydrolase [Candidatus Woesearchaeota archaeon]